MKELFKYRVSAALVLFYAAGIFMGSHVDVKHLLTASVTLLAALITILVISLIRKRRFNYPSIIACVLVFMLGALFINYSIANRHKELRDFIGEKSWVYGTVVSEAELTEAGNHYGITVDVHQLEYKENITPVSGKIIVYVERHDNTAPKVNQNIYFFTELEKPDYTDGSFVYEEYLRTRDIYATGFTHAVYLDTESAYALTPVDNLKSVGRDISMFLQGRIETVFAYDRDACALVKGILLGKKSDFTEEMTQNMSLAGFSHIAAVSGLHLNILFGAFCGLLGF